MPKDHAGTHEENRQKICLLCFGKTKKMFVISGKLRTEVSNIFHYDVNDERLPIALCSGCKRDIYRVKNGVQKNIRLPDISEIRPIRKNTRANAKLHCDCYVCELARMPRTGNFAKNGVLPLRKSILVDSSNTTSNIKTQNLEQKHCGSCLSIIARGKSHKCNLSTRFNNIKKFISDSSTKIKEQVISSLVKDVLTEKEQKTENATLSLSQVNGGLPLTVVVKPKYKSEPSQQHLLLSADDFVKIQTSFNLSQKTTCGIASIIRTATKKRKAVEPHLKTKLSAKIHTLDEYFCTSTDKPLATAAHELTVYCKNLNSFIQYVTQKRQNSDIHLKFGIDGGGGFLKVCLSIQSIERNEQYSTGRQKYEEGITAKRFKDSGVKKLFILGIIQSNQETYENVSKLWSTININNFDGTIATDLKLANVLVGIMAHSSLFPCTWCYARKDQLHERGALRTVANTQQNYMNWSNAGAVKKNAKDYKNCIHPPIVRSDIDRPFLDIIPPPELHLMLGVVNTLFSHMLLDFKEEALAWAKFCNVQREITHGGSGFKGNACKTLLEKIDFLRRDCSLGCLKFVQVFEDFGRVVKSCFGKQLELNFKDNIDSFKKNYLALGINVTPKVHAVFFHVEDFCNKNQQALGFFSEQAMESVHFDFNSVWKKYKVPKNNPDYPGRLLRAVCEYNSLHI